MMPLPSEDDDDYEFDPNFEDPKARRQKSGEEGAATEDGAGTEESAVEDDEASTDQSDEPEGDDGDEGEDEELEEWDLSSSADGYGDGVGGDVKVPTRDLSDREETGPRATQSAGPAQKKDPLLGFGKSPTTESTAEAGSGGEEYYEEGWEGQGGGEWGQGYDDGSYDQGYYDSYNQTAGTYQQAPRRGPPPGPPPGRGGPPGRGRGPPPGRGGPPGRGPPPGGPGGPGAAPAAPQDELGMLKAEKDMMQSKEGRLLVANRKYLVGGWHAVYWLPFLAVGILALDTAFAGDNLGIHIGFLISTLVVAVIYIVSLVIVLRSAALSKKIFELENTIFKKQGRPFESLHGYANVHDFTIRSLRARQTVTAIAGAASLFYFVLIILTFIPGVRDDTAGAATLSSILWFGAGLLFISWGMFALTNMKGGVYNTQERWGLLDIYDPPVHSAYLDYVFSDALTTFMDPILYSQFDEYTSELVDSLEEGADIIRAREKLLYLLYLNENGIIDDGTLRDEAAEVFKEDKVDGIIEHHYFSKEVMQRVIRNARKRILPMFRLVDRLQFNLIDNLEVFRSQDLYFDVDIENIVLDKEGNLFILLFNNSPEEKFFNVRITTSDFTPHEIKFRVALEGRGDFEITSDHLPLSSGEEDDVVGTMATILDIGDALWLNLATVNTKGPATINVFLEDDDGNVLYGKSLRVEVRVDLKKAGLDKGGKGSMGLGALAPLAKVGLPRIRAQLGI